MAGGGWSVCLSSCPRAIVLQGGFCPGALRGLGQVFHHQEQTQGFPLYLRSFGGNLILEKPFWGARVWGAHVCFLTQTCSDHLQASGAPLMHVDRGGGSLG